VVCAKSTLWSTSGFTVRNSNDLMHRTVMVAVASAMALCGACGFFRLARVQLSRTPDDCETVTSPKRDDVIGAW
jgi:hypothetical protein